jgi:uncharacterized membrane protein YhaH (DUF805 family)
MNSESFHCDSAGQGTLPDVPKIGIACTFCAGELVGIEETLPHCCPHCHKELRPASDSLWSNLWYGMRRLLSCSGRATCKEFWVSMILIWIFTCIAILAFCINLGFCFDSDGYINFYLFTGAVIALFLLLLIISQCCLMTRRLHDIGFRGYWALLGCILSVSAFASYIVPFVSLLYDYLQAFDAYLMILSDLSFVSAENEIVSSEFLGMLCGLDEPSLSGNQINYLVYTWYPYSMRILLNFLYTADIIISGFLFVSCFIDSQRGTNQYGLSRKYPIA